VEVLPGPEAIALETLEKVLTALRRLPDRDLTLNALIETIEDDRARLLAAVMSSRQSGRRPQRTASGPLPYITRFASKPQESLEA
jgi:uncharacterized protein YbaP (TraB family)